MHSTASRFTQLLIVWTAASACWAVFAPRSASTSCAQSRSGSTPQSGLGGGLWDLRPASISSSSISIKQEPWRWEALSETQENSETGRCAHEWACSVGSAGRCRGCWASWGSRFWSLLSCSRWSWRYHRLGSFGQAHRSLSTPGSLANSCRQEASIDGSWASFQSPGSRMTLWSCLFA